VTAELWAEVPEPLLREARIDMASLHPLPDDPNQPETEADGKRAGALRLRIARFRNQNEQLKKG